MLSDPARTLRRLILAVWITGILGVALDFALESTLPEPIRTFRDAEFERDPTAAELIGTVVGIFAMAMFIRASYLLYKLRLAGRRLFLWSYLLGVLVTPWFGPFTMSGWAMIPYDVSSMLAGVLLGWLYLAPPSFDPLPSLE